MIEQDKSWNLVWEMFQNKKPVNYTSFISTLKNSMGLKNKLMRLYLGSVGIFTKISFQRINLIMTRG